MRINVKTEFILFRLDVYMCNTEVIPIQKQIKTAKAKDILNLH